MILKTGSEPVSALSMLVHRTRAEGADAMVEKMKELIPPHMFRIPDPGGDRRQGDRRAEDPCALLRQDVTAKCYGGDVTRKRKLLEKLKEENQEKDARIRQDETIPQEAFIAALKVDG